MGIIKNIKKLQYSDLDYPDKAGNAIGYKILSCIGNIQLLDKKAIGICGSRNASDDALIWAHKFGLEAAARNLVVVSGHAKGVDREAHKGAMQAGGSTIAVLPEGINQFRQNRELKPYIRQDNFLAVSMFQDNARWQAWQAMERNKLIVGLSVGIFVVEARRKGGTIDAAMECVRQQKKLWVVTYSDETPGREGNRFLVQESAIPLKELGDVKEALDIITQELDFPPAQFTMGLE